jgi:hypothetical protein
MPRYVLLEHDHPFLHWDLMLESGDVLRTWRLLSLPETGKPIQAEAIFDHRIFYLDYEGPISGNRGHVVRRDRGTFTWLEQHEERVEVELAGEALAGRLVLSLQGPVWQALFLGTVSGAGPAPRTES